MKDESFLLSREMKKKSFIFHLDKSTDLRRDEDEDLDESQKNFYLQALII
jgi:hypothetical protein